MASKRQRRRKQERRVEHVANQRNRLRAALTYSVGDGPTTTRQVVARMEERGYEQDWRNPMKFRARRT